MANEKQEIRILHIDTGLDWRGGQRQALTLHRLLLEKGISSTMLCNEKGEMWNIAQANKIKNVLCFNFRSEYSIRNHLELISINKKVNPNIVHCHDSHSISLSLFLRGSLKVGTRRVSYKLKKISRLFKYSLIDVHVGVSEEIRSYLNKFFKNSHVINSCIDLKRFKNKNRLKIFDANKKNILFVGALTSQKGIDILLPSFKSASQRFLDIHLHIVGDGNLMGFLKQSVKKMNLVEKISIHGWQKNIENFYISSDLIICPSVSGEGSSGVIKEGLAANKTVIASDLQCNKEIIQNNINGLLFHNKDSNSLEKVLTHWLTNNNLIDKENIAKSLEKFSCEKMTEKYIDLYLKYQK